MNKIWKILQYGYLMIAIVFVIEGFLRWKTDRNNAYIMFGFAIFITLVFLFKRNFRKRIEKRNTKQ